MIGGKGVFTKELEDALLEERIDLAVHSLKRFADDCSGGVDHRGDLQARRSARCSGIETAMHRRAVTSLHNLAERRGRRHFQPAAAGPVSHLRGDVMIKDVRGNVDTRLRKLDEGQYDALVLACAGLRRLGLENRISLAIPAAEMLPAVGQGALGLQTRVDDADTIALSGKLDHKFTSLACTAERAFLRKLGGGCQLPIAAYAVVREKRIRLDGLISDPEGKEVIRDRIAGGFDEAEGLGRGWLKDYSSRAHLRCWLRD